jgi:ABC-type branched-subunit amino acid transport system substrate-binding protein
MNIEKYTAMPTNLLHSGGWPLPVFIRNRWWIVSASLLLVVLGAMGLPTVSAQEEHANPDRNIVLGMSTALTGPAAHLGLNMRAGVLAAISEFNRIEGDNGRHLSLVALDDGYEPTRAIPNMYRLIKEENILAVIGNVGTPTAVAAIPIANRFHTPFFGAFTGAGVLRNTPPDRYVINYRASYAEEISAMVDALIVKGGLRPDEIAFFTQRDAYGDAGFVGGITALKKYGLVNESAVAHGRYERNTLAVENGLADIIMAEPIPKAVIMVGTYAPSAVFIRLARKYDLKVLFLNVSFVGAEPLTEELGPEGEGVIITQVVPHFQADLPLVNEFNQALFAWNAEVAPTFGALEGYIATRIFLRALATMDPPPDKEALVDALEGLGEFDLGLGEPLRLGRNEHQASHRVWPTIIHEGRVVPFTWDHLAPSP